MADAVDQAAGRQRRGVTGQDGVGVREAIQLGEHRLLQLEALGDGFDHHPGAGNRLLQLLGERHLASPRHLKAERLLHGVQVAFDVVASRFELICGNVVDADIGAPRCIDRCDALPERSGTVDRNVTLVHVGRERV